MSWMRAAAPAQPAGAHCSEVWRLKEAGRRRFANHTREREVIERLSQPMKDRWTSSNHRTLSRNYSRVPPHSNLAHQPSPNRGRLDSREQGTGRGASLFREPAERSVKKRRPNSWVKKSRWYRGRASNLCSRQSTISPPTASAPIENSLADSYTRATTAIGIASFYFR